MLKISTWKSKDLCKEVPHVRSNSPEGAYLLDCVKTIQPFFMHAKPARPSARPVSSIASPTQATFPNIAKNV